MCDICYDYKVITVHVFGKTRKIKQICFRCLEDAPL